MDTYTPLLFFFIALFSYVATQTCEKSRYDSCMKQLLTFTDKGDLQFASTEEELKEKCNLAKSNLQCLTMYIKKCLTTMEEKSIANERISGMAEVTNGMCGTEKLKTSFINSLPCLRNISSGLQYCKDKYDRNQRDIFEIQYEEKTQIQCCSFDGYRRCMRMVMDTQDGCQEDSAEFLEELSNRMGGSLTQGTCSEHFERCTGHSSGINLQFSTSSIIAILFTMIFFKATIS